jgi:hypothetical protein
MATEKQIQSSINVLNARLDQVKNSPIYKDQDREKLASKIEKDLEVLVLKLEKFKIEM